MALLTAGTIQDKAYTVMRAVRKGWSFEKYILGRTNEGDNFYLLCRMCWRNNGSWTLCERTDWL